MRRLLSLLGGRALDLLLPLRCVGCDREGRFLCERCHDGLPRLSRPYCSVCSAPGGPDPCEWCVSERPAIEGVRAPYLMDGAVRDAVHALKYRGYRAGAPALARLMAGYLSSHAIAATDLVPVPLHRRRERERGYNQSELLAKELGRLIGLPVDGGLLRRTRYGPPQVSLDGHEQRRGNVEGAFECRGPVNGVEALLIDDVVTTGSTMSACASALKAAGATSVWGLALARQA